MGLFTVKTTYHRPSEVSVRADSAGNPPRESEEKPNIPGIIAAAATAMVTVITAISPLASKWLFDNALERQKLTIALQIEQAKLANTLQLEADQNKHKLEQERAKESAAAVKDKNELVKSALGVVDCRQWMRNLRLLAVATVITSANETGLRADLPESGAGIR